MPTRHYGSLTNNMQHYLTRPFFGIQNEHTPVIKQDAVSFLNCNIAALQFESTKKKKNQNFGYIKLMGL